MSRTRGIDGLNIYDRLVCKCAGRRSTRNSHTRVVLFIYNIYIYIYIFAFYINFIKLPEESI